MPETLELLGTPASTRSETSAKTMTQDELVFSAERKITLQCGKASITLHPNGKIVLRGEYILSDAKGVNRIAGGRVELN